MNAGDVALQCDSRARRSGAGWLCRCPAHPDRTPSLSVREGRDGRVLMRCWAGCSTTAVLAAARLTFADICGGSRATPAERRRFAQERERSEAAERANWLAALLRAVAVLQRRHPGDPGLAAAAALAAHDRARLEREASHE